MHRESTDQIRNATKVQEFQMRAPFKPQPKPVKSTYLKKSPLQTIQEAHKTKEFDLNELAFNPVLNLSRTP
jgi:hypothetical protein